MKLIKIVKYTLATLFFVITTSFKPEDIYSEMDRGKTQTEVTLVND